MVILGAIIFFVIGLLLLAAMTYEGYAYLTKRKPTISRWMADRLKATPVVFALLEFLALGVWVVLLLHFLSLLPFWVP